MENITQVQKVLDDIVTPVDTLLLFNPSKNNYQRFRDDTEPVVVAIENEFDEERYVELPIKFQDPIYLCQFGIDGAVDKEFVTNGDAVGCILDLFADTIDSFTRVEVESDADDELYDFFVRSRANQASITEILRLAIELGKQGQKGQQVGALFSIGDAGTVMNSSRSLSYNPFDKSHVHAGDPIVSVMLKEFSRLDGAFIISGAGKVVSAYQYLEPSIDEIDIPKGLGTRHHAAAAITNETNAVTIVLSESDGRVRGFKNGNLVFNIDPDRY